MTLPREVLPGRFYMITRRCTQRQFLMRPDEATNNAFTYCLAEAAQRHKIEVILPSAMSNHHHTVVFDRHGTICELTEHFHKMFAKTQNAIRGRWENFWSTEQVCTVQLVERADVMRKLVYAATNPVKDGLVERVHHWPGVNGLTALLNEEPMHAQRPKQFFRANGKMPKSVTLNLVIPSELGDPDEIRRELRAGVERVEENAARKRRRKGVRVLGKRAILDQSWRDSPTSREQRRNLRPRFAACRASALRDATDHYKAFLAAYREARRHMLAQQAFAFPIGTYWLKEYANVPIATAPTPL